MAKVDNKPIAIHCRGLMFLHLITKSQAEEIGIMYFFTGEPCHKGHISLRYTKGSSCIRCKQEYRKENRERRNELGRESYERNKDSISERRKAYRVNNVERARERHKNYYQKNRDAIIKRTGDHRKANRHLGSYYNAKRRASVKGATPLWARQKSIRAIYAEAAMKELHVDHIVPIQSKYVCGLHCEDNLRPINPTENKIKSNSVWPDMSSTAHPELVRMANRFYAKTK